MASAAVELQREIEALGAHRRKEALQCRHVVARAAHSAAFGHDDDAIDRAGAAVEERGMPRCAEQHDLRLGIDGAQRRRRRQGEDPVADGVRTQHGDAAHAVDMQRLRPSRVGPRA
jgi:hypothetical protein